MRTVSDEDKFRIFISHKHEDGQLAEATKAALENLHLKSGIQCFVSGVDIPAGANWKRVIKVELARSHLLLLLFTNPTRDWDWCLYEAGLFTRFEDEQVTAVVCIYNPESEPPAPLHNLQGIPASPERIATFLERLCKTPWKISNNWKRGPLLGRPDKQKIQQTAKRICRDFRHSSVYHPCHRLVLDMRHTEESGDGIPLDSHVVEGINATTSFTLSLFGVGEGPRHLTWQQLLSAVRGENALWRRQLDKAFTAALREELFKPVCAMLHRWGVDSPHDQPCYKPIIYRIVKAYEPADETAKREDADGSPPRGRARPVEVTIIFERVELPFPSRDLIFNLNRILARFRSDVFAPYLGKMADMAGTAHRPDPIVGLGDALRFVECDAEDYGLLDAASLRSAYGDSYDSQQVASMRKDWGSARKSLDEALQSRDISGIEQALEDMSRIHQNLSIAAAERYCQVLRDVKTG